jgi:hypothetical protein
MLGTGNDDGTEKVGRPAGTDLVELTVDFESELNTPPMARAPTTTAARTTTPTAASRPLLGPRPAPAGADPV